MAAHLQFDTTKYATVVAAKSTTGGGNLYAFPVQTITQGLIPTAWDNIVVPDLIQAFPLVVAPLSTAILFALNAFCGKIGSTDCALVLSSSTPAPDGQQGPPLGTNSEGHEMIGVFSQGTIEITAWTKRGGQSAADGLTMFVYTDHTKSESSFVGTVSVVPRRVGNVDSEIFGETAKRLQNPLFYGVPLQGLAPPSGAASSIQLQSDFTKQTADLPKCHKGGPLNVPTLEALPAAPNAGAVSRDWLVVEVSERRDDNSPDAAASRERLQDSARMVVGMNVLGSGNRLANVSPAAEIVQPAFGVTLPESAGKFKQLCEYMRQPQGSGPDAVMATVMVKEVLTTSGLSPTIWPNADIGAMACNGVLSGIGSKSAVAALWDYVLQAASEETPTFTDKCVQALVELA